MEICKTRTMKLTAGRLDLMNMAEDKRAIPLWYTTTERTCDSSASAFMIIRVQSLAMVPATKPTCAIRRGHNSNSFSDHDCQKAHKASSNRLIHKF